MVPENDSDMKLAEFSILRYLLVECNYPFILPVRRVVIANGYRRYWLRKLSRVMTGFSVWVKYFLPECAGRNR